MIIINVDDIEGLDEIQVYQAPSDYETVIRQYHDYMFSLINRYFRPNSYESDDCYSEIKTMLLCLCADDDPHEHEKILDKISAAFQRYYYDFRKKNREVHDDLLLALVEDPSHSPDENIIVDDAIAQIRARFSSMHAYIFELRALQGLKYRQISEEVGLTIGAVWKKFNEVAIYMKEILTQGA